MKVLRMMILVIGVFSFSSASSPLLLGDENGNLQVYDACTSLDGNSALVAGTRHTGIKSVYIANIIDTPRLHTVWENYVNFSNGANEYGFGICPVEQQIPNYLDAEYIVCGYVGDVAQEPAMYLFDGDGVLIAAEIFSSEVFGRFKSCIQTRDGGFALLGETESTDGSPSQVFVLALDNHLDYRWHSVYNEFLPSNTESYTYPNCLMETSSSVGEMLIFLATPHNSTRAGNIVCVDNCTTSPTEGQFLSSWAMC